MVSIQRFGQTAKLSAPAVHVTAPVPVPAAAVVVTTPSPPACCVVLGAVAVQVISTTVVCPVVTLVEPHAFRIPTWSSSWSVVLRDPNVHLAGSWFMNTLHVDCVVRGLGATNLCEATKW